MAATTPHLRADARRNRERIVAAAAELFAARGTECQMAEIARHAGVGNATVFRHFPAKQDLVMAIAEQKMGAMLAFAESVAEHEDPAEGLRLLVDHLCAQSVRNAALKEITAAHFEGDERLIAIRDRLLAVLGRLVGRCQAAGTVRADVEPIDVVVLVNGVASAVLGLEELRPGLHHRYLALALAGLSPRAADGPLPMEPPTPDELETAFRRSAALHGRTC
jgi:AcrR family transcriptional regulator